MLLSALVIALACGEAAAYAHARGPAGIRRVRPRMAAAAASVAPTTGNGARM